MENARDEDGSDRNEGDERWMEVQRWMAWEMPKADMAVMETHRSMAEALQEAGDREGRIHIRLWRCIQP